MNFGRRHAGVQLGVGDANENPPQPFANHPEFEPCPLTNRKSFCRRFAQGPRQ
jgi:hypothetical protein